MSEDKKQTNVVVKIKGLSFNMQGNLKRKPKKDKEVKEEGVIRGRETREYIKKLNKENK